MDYILHNYEYQVYRLYFLLSAGLDKLFKGVHKIKGKNVSVRYAKPPTDKQKAQAVLTSTGEEAASTLTAQRHVSAKKVAAQQEPLEQHMKPTSSTLSPLSEINKSEQLASNSSFTTVATQSQPALQQSSGQVSTLPTSPHVDSTVEHTQGIPPLPDMASATGYVDPVIFANMNIFEAAKLPPPRQPVTLQEAGRVHSFPVMSVPGSLDVPAAVSQPMKGVQPATTLPPPLMSMDLAQVGSSEVTIPQQPFSQPPSQQWPSLHEERTSRQMPEDIVQQQESQAAVQHGRHAAPLYAEYAGTQQRALITQQHSVHPVPPDRTHLGPFSSGHTGLGCSTHTRPQHSSYHGQLHSGSFGVQLGGPTGQQHLGVMQSDDQKASIGKSSLIPTGYSPVNTGEPMPHTGTSGEVSESVPPQEWPSFPPENDQPLPTTAPPLTQALSISDQNSAMVQVEGVSGLNSKYLRVAFDNEDQGGGEIDDIVLNGDVALITFKDVIGKCMHSVPHIHSVHMPLHV